MSRSGSRKRRSSNSDRKSVSFGRPFKQKSNRHVSNNGRKCAVYIESLKQSELRYVNFSKLQRRLSEINIRSFNDGSFSTALDLTQELESSLKYFVDIKMEMIFLRKLKRAHCSTPFSYNEIEITNRSELSKRLSFIKSESSYRSNRMDLLFHQLQSVVLPWIVEDIRCVQRVLYLKSWTDRAHIWYNHFKRIQCSEASKFVESRAKKKELPKHRIEDEIDLTIDHNVDSKSEVVIIPKVATLRESDGRDLNTTSGNINQTESIYANVMETLKNLTDLINGTIQNNCKDICGEDESDQSKSFDIIEPNIEVISISDDD